MTIIATVKFLQKRNLVLRKKISDLKKLNEEQSDALNKARCRIQYLKAENATLRMEKASLIYGKSKLELMGGDGSNAK